ncbi:MAG: hypothetical protein IJK97_12795 [Thermoguttaceae bacterium]|nr:hypothetical protein [Thermoguttaceae bacterium]
MEWYQWVFTWGTSSALPRQMPLRGRIDARESGECRLRDCITALQNLKDDAASVVPVKKNLQCHY